MKVAILGAAHPHVSYALDEVARRPELELVAAAESDPAMRATFLHGLDIPLYDEPDDLLAEHDVDVALVAGVYADRAEAVLAALRSGAHVLADKPLCTSLDQLDRIEIAARQADRQVSVVFEKRFYPPTLALEGILADGELGQLALVAATGPHKLNQASRPDWFLRRRTYGGIAADLPVHDIDLVLRFTGALSGWVSAVSGNARPTDHPGFDDHVAVLLRAGSVAATLEANWLGPQAADVHGHYRMRVTGSEGTAELDWAYNRLTLTTHAQPHRELALGQPTAPAAYFFDAVSEGRVPQIDTGASVLATRIALLAQRSADNDGRPEPWTAPVR